MLLFYGHFATVIVLDSAAKACISVEERVKCKLDHAQREILYQFSSFIGNGDTRQFAMSWQKLKEL